MALRYMYASGLFQAYLLLRYASGLFQAYLLFLSLFSPFIPKLLKGAIFRPKNIFTRLLLPLQKLATLGGHLFRLVVKQALGAPSPVTTKKGLQGDYDCSWSQETNQSIGQSGTT